MLNGGTSMTPMLTAFRLHIVYCTCTYTTQQVVTRVYTRIARSDRYLHESDSLSSDSQSCADSSSVIGDSGLNLNASISETASSGRQTRNSRHDLISSFTSWAPRFTRLEEQRAVCIDIY